MTEIITQTEKMIYLITDINMHQVFHYKTRILEYDEDNNDLIYLYLPSATSTRIAKQCLFEMLGEDVDNDWWKQMKVKLKSGTK